MATNLDENIQLNVDSDSKRKAKLEALNQIQRKKRIEQDIKIKDTLKIKSRPASGGTEIEEEEAGRSVPRAPKAPMRHKGEQPQQKQVRVSDEKQDDSSEPDDQIENVIIPSVTGMPYQQAANSLLSQGLDVFPYYIEGDSPEPIVVSSQPEAGSEAVLGQTITLVVAVSSSDDEEEEENKEDEKDEENEADEAENEEDPNLKPKAKAGEAGAGEGAAAEGGAAAGAGAAEGGAAVAGVEVGTAAGGAGIMAFLAATWEVWVPVLLIILLTIFIVLIVVITPVAICNTSVTARIASLGFCESLQIGTSGESSFQGGASGGGGASGDFNPDDLVTLIGLVPVDRTEASDPRARQCMAYKLQQIYAQTQAERPPIQWEITSAYRTDETTASGGVSAHGRGEAADLSLRNPAVPIRSSDPRILRLVEIAESVGFVQPAGDTLNEYARPARNATGGHIHVEYNIPANGSYCDGTANRNT